MKKSSLITLALASLVSLVGCNKASAPSKSAVEKACEVYLKSYFHSSYYMDDEDYFTDKMGNRYKDEDGNEVRLEVKQGEVADDTFDASGLLDPQKVSEEEYYKIPESEDSYSFIIEINYGGLTEALVNTYRDNILNNSAYYAFGYMFEEDFDDETITTLTSVFDFDVGYFTWITPVDRDDDGENDFAYMEVVNQFEEVEDLFFYALLYSYIYEYQDSTGATAYAALVQLDFQAVPADVQFEAR